MNSDIKDVLFKANQAFKENDGDRACSVLMNAMKMDIRYFEHVYQLGLAYANANFYDEAVEVFKVCKFFKKDDLRIFYNLGLIYSLKANHNLALDAYDQALKIQPTDLQTLFNKALSLNDVGNYKAALELMENVIAQKNDFAQAWFNKGLVLNNLKSYQAAIEAYNQAININPEYYQAYFNKAITLENCNQYLQAIECYNSAISLNPDYAEAYVSRGIAQHRLRHFTDAIISYNQAISLDPNYADAYVNRGIALHELKRYVDAIASYDKALALDDGYQEAWANKAVTFHQLRRLEDAVKSYERAISLKPNCYVSITNKGVALIGLNRHEEAVNLFDRAIEISPAYAEAWKSKAEVFTDLKQYDRSIYCYKKALELDPNIEWLYGNLLHTQMRVCEWSQYEQYLQIIGQKLLANKKVATPFTLLSLIDDPVLQKRSAEIYSQNIFPPDYSLGPISKSTKDSKIRVGYFSGDLKNHAVSFLIAELFELHNRDTFEVIAFSYGHDKSPMRSRLEAAFDEFYDVENMSDLDVARLSRDLDINIAVDLSGYTAKCRTAIFSYRAAPIQVSYLGYLGTMGSTYIDYILADRILVPFGSEQFYSENIAFLQSYQVNDRKRIISSRKILRRELGLPEGKFIFCCFNNSYKITPYIFKVWMNILKSVENSVLYLFGENKLMEVNLKAEACRQGVDPDRLVFGKSLPPEEYLARYKVCDLFLDTFPYNAGTTASDALWAGLPVITLMGQSFASRMASSILNSVGLPELISGDLTGYQRLAINLAKDSQELAKIKSKLEHNRAKSDLFDTPKFVKNLELTYLEMCKKSWGGLQPEHIDFSLNQ